MVNIKNKQKDTKTPTKIKFLDEEDVTIDGEYFTADEEAIGQDTILEEEEEDDDSDSDSDSDDAPEEESTTTTKQSILNKQKQQFQLEQEQKRIEREKRRKLDLQNKEQQDSKKSKKQQKIEELPEFLPTDILESDNEEEANKKIETVKPKHYKLSDLDEIEARKQLKIQKLKDLKNKKTTLVKKGPVSVQVQSFNSNKKVVPKAENKVLDTREQWLQRKSLRRK